MLEKQRFARSPVADMLPAGSRVSHTNIHAAVVVVVVVTFVYSSDAAMAALTRGVLLLSELLQVTNQAGLLASMRGDSPLQAAGWWWWWWCGGEKSCSRRHRRGGGGGVASEGRCVPYRHDNRLRGSRLLPRFRRLTLHSGYDGWSDSAPKNQEGPSCRLACLPGERAPPGGQDVKLHPRENNTGKYGCQQAKGAKSTKSWMKFEEIWDWIVLTSKDLHVRWFLFFLPPEFLRNLCGYVLIYLLNNTHQGEFKHWSVANLKE